MKPVLLVGCWHEVIELCERCGRHIAGIIDSAREGEYMGHAVLGGDSRAAEIQMLYPNVPVVLAPDRPQPRGRLASEYENLGFSFDTLVDPDATISRTASFGRGVLVHVGANVSAGVRVGDFARINAGANVMHDAEVGEGSTIAPSAVLLGRVRLAPACYIGAAAVLLPGIVVGKGAVVGAGAVVTKDVAEGTKVVGNPAAVLR